MAVLLSGFWFATRIDCYKTLLSYIVICYELFLELHFFMKEYDGRVLRNYISLFCSRSIVMASLTYPYISLLRRMAECNFVMRVQFLYCEQPVSPGGLHFLYYLRVIECFG